jgi:cellulose synthase/poly-beta-1,6-N-acetylglucosamine synthase-like glycosyltransferase
MWITPSAIFWGSAGVVAYTYAGYPLLIHLASRLKPRPVNAAPITPTVSVVVAARNEESNIGRKLDNLLAADYPADRLQIVVVSDGSTDRTDEIVRGYSDRGVLLERVEPSSGKPTALNRGVARASGEIVLFCDARQRVADDALRAVVAPFADPSVGGVTGELVMESSQGPGVYWKYEKLIRSAESRFDSLVTATGAFFAIRRHLFQELPADLLVDDIYTPMNIAMQGYRILFEPGARIFDREVDIGGEFSRKARTLAGNYQVLQQLPRLLHPLKNRLFWQYASHKILRLLCPFALGGLLLSNAALVVTGAPPWPLYVATLGAQLTCYGLALAGGKPDAGKLASVCRTFVVLNAAAVEGLRRYAKGDFAWTTVK